jgi:hypothetical protein
MNTDKLTADDWLQIEQAANGCISGTSDEWPALRRVIEKLRGEPMVYRQTAAWLSGFCIGVLYASGRWGKSVCVTCGATKESDEMFSNVQCQMCWEAQCALSWHDAMW